MKTLKFRAWDKEEKKYLLPEKQGFIIVPTSPSFGVTLPYHRGRNFSGDEDCFDWADADLLMGRYELEQYTGIKDKNGKEIYEGDIVNITAIVNTDDSDMACIIDTNSIVCWDKEHGRWDVNDKPEDEDLDYRRRRYFVFVDSEDRENVEVIGNIHENPELLKGDE